jgi:Cytochrome bd terminal oxidase subunit II
MATLFSALYLPVLLMLAGLILRGVAFEFRNKAQSTRWIWDADRRLRICDRREPAATMPSMVGE